MTDLGKGARSFAIEKRKFTETNAGLRSSRKAREEEVRGRQSRWRVACPH